MKKKKIIIIVLIILVVLILGIYGYKAYLLHSNKDLFEHLDITKNHNIHTEQLFTVHIDDKIDKNKEYYGLINDKDYYIATSYLPDFLTKTDESEEFNKVYYSSENKETTVIFRVWYSGISIMKDLLELTPDSYKYMNNHEIFEKEIPNIKNDYELIKCLMKNEFRVSETIFDPLYKFIMFFAGYTPKYIEMLEEFYPDNYLLDEQQIIIGYDKTDNTYRVSIPANEEKNYIVLIGNPNNELSKDDIQKILNNLVIIKK